MKLSQKDQFARLLGVKCASGSTADDLQNVLLQIVFALLMVFVIAYFMFVSETKKNQEEQVLDLNRQKLVLALEKAVEDHRIKYGLNALMTQGTDGQRVFDPDSHVVNGRINMSAAARRAFASGSTAAFDDYKNVSMLRKFWYDKVLADSAVLNISSEEQHWLESEIINRVESLRLDVRGVQRALAARLQENLVKNPDSLAAIQDPNALAEAIKTKSLEMIKESIGTEVLP